MSEKALPLLDLTDPASQVAERWRKYRSVRLNTLPKERTSIMFVRRPLYSYTLLAWISRISLKIYKILVLFRKVVTMFKKSLFANWILIFESRRTSPMSDMFFVNSHKGKGRPLTHSLFGCENKHDIVISGRV